jgi:hypothetical protein
VHRLVAGAFHGPPPNPRAQAAHLNGIKTDNRWFNLAWVTPKANALHNEILNGKGRGALTDPVKLRAVGVLRAANFDKAEIGKLLNLRPTGRALTDTEDLKA